MTIVLTEPWQVALFVLFCLAAMYLIVRRMWREWTSPPPSNDPNREVE